VRRAAVVRRTAAPKGAGAGGAQESRTEGRRIERFGQDGLLPDMTRQARFFKLRRRQADPRQSTG
jgi:hypothetical protein